MKVPNNVFHHHDRIIHENADREDQSEQRDPVQREPPEVKNQQRQRQRRRNGDCHNAGLPPAQRQPNQDRHAEHRDAHVQQQLVGFLRRRLAIVAGNAHREICRNDLALQSLHLRQHLFRHRDRVRSRPFGNAQGHGGFLTHMTLARRTCRPMAKEHVLRRFLTAIHDLRHLTQIHRAPTEHTHDHIAHILRRLEKRTRLHQHLGIPGRQTARTKLPVRLLQHRHEADRTQIARRQLHRIEHDPNLPPRATNEMRFRHQRHSLHFLLHLRRKTPQHEMIVARTVKGQRQDRHIVDRLRFDHWPRDAHRDAIKIRPQLLRQLEQTQFRILAHLEPHNDKALAVLRRGIHILDARDLPEKLLHRASHPLLHFLRVGTGHRHHHVDHRHLDLRLLLTRQQHHRRRA